MVGKDHKLIAIIEGQEIEGVLVIPRDMDIKAIVRRLKKGKKYTSSYKHLLKNDQCRLPSKGEFYYYDPDINEKYQD